MSRPLEDYAVIGDTETAALVDTDGSVDWLCLPRFDADACFAALLGGPEHGRWSIAPTDEVREVRGSYREGTLILETEFVAATGTVRLTDAMPPRASLEVRGHLPDVIRVVDAVDGEAPKCGWSSPSASGRGSHCRRATPGCGRRSRRSTGT